MNITDFDKAFRLGLGRAYLHVKENSDDGVKEIILRHCLNNPCYDTQGEPSRAPWIMSVIDLCAAPEFYYESIIRALAIECDDRNLSQLYDLAFILAKRGDKAAEKRIYERFDKQEFNETWLGGDHIVELHGLKGLEHIANILGNRMLKEDGYWDDSVYPKACDFYGKDKVDEHLGALAKNNPAVAAYLKSSQKIYDTWGAPRPLNSEEELKEKTRKEVTLELILSNIENKKCSLSKFMRFGRYATDEELNIIYNKLIAEDRDEQLKRYLWIFRKRELPRLDDEVFLLANSDNEGLKNAAIMALSQTTHAHIREFAIEIHGKDDTNRFIECLGLFIKNHQAGDYRYIERALIESDDFDVIFSLCYDILNIFEENTDAGMLKCLVWVYKNNPCAHCRVRVVKLLEENGLLPDDITDEYEFDCSTTK